MQWQTVADGVSALLGGEKAEGIIGLQIGVGEQDLREDGHYVAIEPRDGERPDISALRVEGERLLIATGDHRVPLEGWNYLLIRVRTAADIGSAWQEMSSLSRPLKVALDELANAGSNSGLASARKAMSVALQAVRFSTDLTAADRARVVREMILEWRQAVEDKKALVEASSGADSGDDSVVFATRSGGALIPRMGADTLGV